MLKSRKTGKCVDTVRFALKRKISVKTVKREYLDRGRVGAFKENSWKTDKKVRYTVWSTKRSLAENGNGTDTVGG